MALWNSQTMSNASTTNVNTLNVNTLNVNAKSGRRGTCVTR